MFQLENGLIGWNVVIEGFQADTCLPQLDLRRLQRSALEKTESLI